MFGKLSGLNSSMNMNLNIKMMINIMFNCAKISKLQLYYKKQEMHTAVHLTVVPLNSPEISLEVTLLQVPHILQVPTA